MGGDARDGEEQMGWSPISPSRTDQTPSRGGGGPDTHAWHSVGGRAGGAPQGRYGPRGPGMMSGGVRAGGQAGPGASGTQEDVETAEGSKERP